MIGGIGVGYSAGYAWQTAFNTFGALSIASGLFGMPYAVALRIGANVFSAVYTVVCSKGLGLALQPYQLILVPQRLNEMNGGFVNARYRNK